MEKITSMMEQKSTKLCINDREITVSNNGKTRPFVDETVLNDGLTKFQDFAGLEKTGRLDAETQKLMKTPRCGIDDRLAPFVTQGSDWKSKAPAYPLLTYRINKYPTTYKTKRLSKQNVDEETIITS